MEDRVRDGPRYLRTLRACVALVVLLIAGSTTRGIAFARSPTSSEVLAVQTAIEVGNRNYLSALKTRDARRFAALFADDAISLPPLGPPIRGRVEIENSMTQAFRRVSFLDGSTHTIEIQLYADTAVEIGSYRYAIVTDGFPSELHGRYLTMWRLINGSWKIELDSSQPDAPAPDPVATFGPAQSTSP